MHCYDKATGGLSVLPTIPFAFGRVDRFSSQAYR